MAEREPFITFQDAYLNIYTKSFLWQTRHYNVLIDAGLLSGAQARLPWLGGGRQTVLLMTHGHWDHIGCCGLVRRQGGRILAHSGDARHFSDHAWHWELLFGQFAGDFDLPPARHTVFWSSVGEEVTPDAFVRDGDTLEFDDLRFRVIGLAGHSQGSVCYLEENSGVLFTGDGLMGNGFFSGVPQIADYDAYTASLERLRRERASLVVTDHTPVEDGAALPRLIETSGVCAARLLAEVQTYANHAETLSVGGAAKAIACAESKGVGGGTCVSALAALWRMGNDPRARSCASRYLCGV